MKSEILIVGFAIALSMTAMSLPFLAGVSSPLVKQVASKVALNLPLGQLQRPRLRPAE